MENYIIHYIIPVLIIMIVLLVIAHKFKDGRNFRFGVLICIGFLLGWVSAFISLYIFFVKK